MKYASLFLVLVFCFGCSGGTAVKGTVKFDDGSPLTEGMVKFVSDKTQAVGVVKPDGSYVMYENKPGDGVTPGSYVVTVTAQTGGGSDGPPVVNLVDPKFSDPNTSGLSCDVKGATTYDIKVTKPAGK